MKRKSFASRYEGKSLKTFFLYATLVIFIILVALAIKLFFVIRASKFDGQHQFIIALAKRDNVQEIISFDPTADTTSVLQVQGKHVSVSSMQQTLAILPNVVVAIGDIEVDADVTKTVWQMVVHYGQVKTNLTLYDMARLLLFSRSVPQANRQEETVSLPMDSVQMNKMITGMFTDSTVSQENLTVQIINATGISGLGQQLEQVLEDQGANVVAITTAQSVLPQSAIQYFGKDSYTLEKLKKLLKYPTRQLATQTIADIVITIGGDSRSKTNF